MRKKTFGRFFKSFGLPLAVFLFSSCQGGSLLDPKGPIGSQEKSLILITFALMLIVAIPVFAMVIWFSVRYRETNKKATYKPEWEGSLKIETVIWLVPLAIIGVLSYLTWVKTIDLDPYKPIASTERPLHVEVVSLDWNWLFIYPDENIASVNKLVIPEGRPVTFDLTSATVMTSFFIPQLGSQIYAMAGMTTHLNLEADSPGTFLGENMEYSGNGYASMHFDTVSLPQSQFAAWVQTAKASPSMMTLSQFNQLNTPTLNYPVTTYSSVDPGLFDHVVHSFDNTMPMQQAMSADMTMPTKK